MNNSSGYLISVDPSELASRFPYDDPRYDEEDESLEDVLDPDGLVNIGDDVLASLISSDNRDALLEPLLERIPAREADLIQLYFSQDKRQAEIAEIFGITQAAVSYRLARGIQRLQFLIAVPNVTEDAMRADLVNVFPAKFDCANCAKATGVCTVCSGLGSFYLDVEILVGMWLTTCQSEVASKLGLIQGHVRHRFFRAVKILEEVAKTDERYAPYQKIFSAIAGKKFNILREVKLPQWSNRGGFECY